MIAHREANLDPFVGIKYSNATTRFHLKKVNANQYQVLGTNPLLTLNKAGNEWKRSDGSILVGINANEMKYKNAQKEWAWKAVARPCAHCKADQELAKLAAHQNASRLAFAEYYIYFFAGQASVAGGA